MIEILSNTQESSTLANTSARVPELDGLRGLAIFLVIICHYVANSQHAQLGFWWHHFFSALTIGWSGVDLFFVLSGFLIGGILLDARDSSNYFRAFYMRRVHRILPIYFSLIILYVLAVGGLLVFLPHNQLVSRQELSVVPRYFLFLQNFYFEQTLFQWKWFAATWSLAVEEQFYLFSPPLIRYIKESILIRILGAVVIVAPLLRVFVFLLFPQYRFLATFAMPCRADSLALGMLAALAWRKPSFKSFLQKKPAMLQNLLTVLVLGLAAMLWWLDRPVSLLTVSIGYTWLAALYVVLLLLVLSQKKGWIAGVMRWSALRALGTISYCVYLIHLTVNQFAHLLLLGTPPRIYDWKGAGVTLLALAITLGVAILSWRFFEKPLIRRGHSYHY